MLRRPLAISALAAAALTLSAAQRPAGFGQVSPGLWEISGLPGGKPLLQCITATTVLAQLEHRARSCSQRVLRDGPTSLSVDYSCGPGEFGRSDVDVLTPRSLRIKTQGISQQLPFSYLLQARRIGECPNRH